jgi:hypothetical protein
MNFLIFLKLGLALASSAQHCSMRSMVWRKEPLPSDGMQGRKGGVSPVFTLAKTSARNRNKIWGFGTVD